MPDSALPLERGIRLVGRGQNWASPLAVAFSFLTLAAFAGAVWLFRWKAPGVDFTSFWAAGQLALQGHGSLAYDYGTHHAVETTVADVGRAVPFPYPPPFLLVVLPFGFHPYWLSYLVWIAGTGTFYLAAMRRILPPAYALGFPAAFDHVIFGQNAFLTCSVFLIGTSLLESQPLLAGAVLGLFVCKPQLAILFPVAVLASRNWRAIAGAAASSIALAAIAAVLFGFGSYAGFLTTSGRYTAMMARDYWPWEQVASLFGAARYLGIPETQALLLQAGAACLVIALTWRAWALRLEQRVPILAAGTMLVSPYLFTYDSLLLIIPMAWFLKKGETGRAAIIWLLSLLTLLSLFGLCPTPNLTPLAAAASLWWLHSESLSRRRGSLQFGATSA